MGNLTIARIKTLTTPGTYVDGDGLMLVVAPGGSRSWRHCQTNVAEQPGDG